jgi:hypothetical protein
MVSMKDAERKFQIMRNQGDDIDYMRSVFEGADVQYKDCYMYCDDPIRDCVPYFRPVHVF